MKSTEWVTARLNAFNQEFKEHFRKNGEHVLNGYIKYEGFCEATVDSKLFEIQFRQILGFRYRCTSAKKKFQIQYMRALNSKDWVRQSTIMKFERRTCIIRDQQYEYTPDTQRLEPEGEDEKIVYQFLLDVKAMVRFGAEVEGIKLDSCRNRKYRFISRK